MNEKIARIVELADGTRSSAQISSEVSLSRRYISRILQKLDLPRLREGARSGKNNHRFVSGRRIDPDGYVLITAPQDHPYARKRTNRETKLIFEHRLVMEKVLGRYLLPTEIVDHIDGLTLHNSPENLRLFQSNGEHLAETITGRKKVMSAKGRQNLRTAHHLRANLEPVDTHKMRRKSGDARLRQIYLLALKLGTDSPYLLGTSHHTKKAGIDLSCCSKIQLALDDLYLKWA